MTANHPLCYQIHYFARTLDSRFLLLLPAFTCALPLSAGRTGQPDDLLPEFDVEFMPGTASRLPLCLTACRLLAFLSLLNISLTSRIPL